VNAPAALRLLPPEVAHAAALLALRAGLGPRLRPDRRPALATRLGPLDLPNPVGLAAGFDKNAVALPALARMGFGFVEIGAVTPRPQPGNPRPRLFRLPAEGAVINRMGFNNDGMEAVADRLQKAGPQPVPVGANLGANRDSEDRAGDYAALLARLGPLVDFVTINISSPNTAGLRDLAGRDALAALLDRVMRARAGLSRPAAVFLKVSPDMRDGDLATLARQAVAAGVDGLIATNTTTARAGLAGRHAAEAGGLSGRPLFAPSTCVLARLAEETAGDLPLIGAGGIDGPESAWQKIRAGATAVQLYTGLVHEGAGLVGRILAGLDARRVRHGLTTLAEAAGNGRAEWLDAGDRS